jgi:8-oxo-dGTP diphosphatase
MAGSLFSIGAFAIIFDNKGRVLLCHRRDMNIWNLPGGGVERGELPSEAVIREVREETGLMVKIENLVGIYGKTDKDELVFSFTCNVTGGKLSATEEADALKYFKLENLPANTSPKQVERIRDAMKPVIQPIFTRQTAPSTQELLIKLHQNG